MYHDSRFFSFASRSYFSISRWSTLPCDSQPGVSRSARDTLWPCGQRHERRAVRNRIWPPMVDLPASTWPMNTRFTCSLAAPSQPQSLRQAGEPDGDSRAAWATSWQRGDSSRARW